MTSFQLSACKIECLQLVERLNAKGGNTYGVLTRYRADGSVSHYDVAIICD